MEDINALELLKEEMSTEEIHLKVNAIHRLKIVVLYLGQNDSVSQLLPYLDSKKSLALIFFSAHQSRGWWSSFRNRWGAWKDMGATHWQDNLPTIVGKAC